MTACAGNEPAVIQRVYQRQELPVSLLSCAADPNVPTAPVTEFAVLEYVARLRAALMDCRYRLHRVAALVTGEGEADARAK